MTVPHKGGRPTQEQKEEQPERKKEFIQLYLANNCRALVAAKAMNIPYTTIKRWRDNDPEFNNEYEETYKLFLEQMVNKMVNLSEESKDWRGISNFLDKFGHLTGWHDRGGKIKVHFKNKCKTMEDVVNLQEEVFEQLMAGKITQNAAERFDQLIKSRADILNAVESMKRIDALEARLKEIESSEQNQGVANDDTDTDTE